ncbi:aldehyde dehydrogenase family protein [Nocardioides daeguensis]|uniref:Aldehyde dehydrogenase family protein n=1 Tax=Nocardioides daeguensis TaxID=908359 RepID=A0ABP6V3A8_9ACTN|nr:aldehyde dehydrogenase family protein [Nocardioides daeguensis]MBV6726517.1 aldehyde dehydrogenase family protein [Nocardioides daeguensis]MCR1772360.1 aldehyde dehydrogenase family protein [Nocardioides daeguensis]
MRAFSNFIDGRWVEAPGVIPVDDPSTGEVFGHVPDSGAEVIDSAVAAARRAFDEGPWSRWSVRDRAEALRRLASALEQSFDTLVDDLVADTGATARFCPMLQVGAPMAHLRDFAEMAHLLEEPEAFPLQANPGLGQWELHREPVGVVGAFTPYNFPLFMCVWKVAPALLAGNTVVLKPSPLTPVGPDALAAAAIAAELPPGVLNIVHGDRVAGEALVAHPAVDLISFTGSTAVGTRIMAAAAATAKEVVLELGGKSPAVVLPDADAELAVRGTLFSSMMHAGQACVATTRMLVPDARYDEFVELLAERAGALQLGPAAEFTTDVGPVISAAARTRIEKIVAASIEQGGRAIVGGQPPTGVPEGGYYVSPTVIVDIDNRNPAAAEEIFGPVLSVIRYSDVDDAVRIANDTPYGLAAAVWGTDLVRAREVALRVRGGLTWINDVAQADVMRTPLAGKGMSGVGQENGRDGLFAYTKTRSLFTALDTNLDVRAYGVVGSEWE